MKILIVEDDDETRRGLLRLLQDNGHEVVQANGRTQAMGYLKRWIPELIISDLNTDEACDGLKLVADTKLGKKRLQARFWLVSAGMTNGITDLAKDYGAERAISKSILLQVLKEEGIIT